MDGIDVQYYQTSEQNTLCHEVQVLIWLTHKSKKKMEWLKNKQTERIEYTANSMKTGWAKWIFCACVRACARDAVEHENYHYYYWYFIRNSNVFLSSLNVPQANSKKLNERKNTRFVLTLFVHLFLLVHQFGFHLGVVFFLSSFLSVCLWGNSISSN